MANNNFYIQYHNADKLKCFPTKNVDFNSLVSDINLDDTEKEDELWIYTTKKKTVEKSIGSRCFLIVGKTENKIKNYCLWCHFKIENYEETPYDVMVKGSGQDLKKPILLNNLHEFDSFKKFCGNFGIGFQNISNHDFSQTLYSYINEIKLDHILLDRKIFLEKEIHQLNNIILSIETERKMQVVERVIRDDRKLVNLLKEYVDYKCQFPDCDSHIPDKNGVNYVEVAHIKAAAKGGKSVIGNLIVLCPNHHKEFDLGARNIFIQNTDMISGLLNGKNFEINLAYNYSYKIK